MQPWKTRDRRTILECGKYLTVESHTVELPDGRTIEDWAWVVTPDYINVVVVTDDDRFLCFRQPKYAANGITLALVGGYIEPGEDPLAAAQRELREETGCEAPNWTLLGDYAVDGNRGAGRGYLYLAQRACRVTDIDADDLEEQEMLLLSREEVEAALWAGEFKILSWAGAVALALLKLGAE
jgi:ADP-ribose pyrophosphatase